VTACFSAQKVTVLAIVAFTGWTPLQLQSGQYAVVRFTKGSRSIIVTAYWNGGPTWQVTDTG
jgi:hypothetical protein